jgi:hypothetical protein
MPSDDTSTIDPTKLDYRNYLIGFLDALGQSTVLRQFGVLHEADLEALQETLHKDVQHIRNVRRVLAKFYENAGAPSPLLDSVPDAEKQRILALRDAAGYFRAFSDSLVLVVPISKDDQYRASLLGVWRAVLAGAAFLGASLANRKPLRGGIDLAIGVDISSPPGPGISPGEIYGPALAHAYHFESQIAEYPRIIVGGRLQRFLTVIANCEELTTQGGQLARTFARKTMDFFVLDKDGYLVVDFIGPAVHEFKGLTPELVAAMYGFAKTELQRFRENGDAKLVARYQRLVDYCVPRLSLWGLDP